MKSRKKKYRIWITKEWFEDYEATTAREAIEQMKAETGHFWFWDIRLIKEGKQ